MDTMYIKVGVKMTSYIPEKIEAGMIFIKRDTEDFVSWVLPFDIPEEEKEEFLKHNGAPVKISLYQPNYEFELPIEEVGWVDITDDDMDQELVYEEFDLGGFLELYNDDEFPELLVGVYPLTESLEIVPAREQGKCVIAFFEEEDEEDSD